MTTQEYVTKRWKRFFGTNIGLGDLGVLTSLVDQFRSGVYDTLAIEVGFEFIRNNPVLMKYEKNQIGQGEFALYLLYPDAEKVAGTKGDIRLMGRTYEVKKIKRDREAIRFGTNVDLSAITEFRFVTYGLRRVYRDPKYSGLPAVDDFRTRYLTIMDGSDASIGLVKMNPLYDLFHEILGHFRRPDAHCPNVVWLLEPFVAMYPTAGDFGKKVVDELVGVYRESGVDILVITKDNTFKVNPDFEYHSINQSVRAQVTLK